MELGPLCLTLFIILMVVGAAHLVAYAKPAPDRPLTLRYAENYPLTASC